MRFTPLLSVFAAIGLVTAGCASAPAFNPTVRDAGLPEPCWKFAGDSVFVGVDAAVVRPGDTAPIGASVRRNYNPGYEMVPAVCLSDWRVSPVGAAAVTPDGTRVTFAPDLPAGTTVAIEARTPGEPARATVIIAGRNEALLVGRYSEVEATCDGPSPRQPVQELRFTRDGHFSLTWQPFERYVDYWGDYVHDPETGRMTLTVTGGNRVPDSGTRLSGTAELRSDDHRLIMDGFYFGDGQSNGSGQTCRYVFAGPSLQ